MSVDAAVEVAPIELREVCAEWVTGVSVITGSSRAGEPKGMAVNSFTSVSLDPPLVSFCPAKSSSTWAAMRDMDRFAVNILAADQREVASVFARSGGDKFSDISYSSDRSTPVLDGCVAYMVCDIVNIHDAGDHEIVVGQVRRLEKFDRDPLVFHRGKMGA